MPPPTSDRVTERPDLPGRGERLLVVEDEVDIADLLRAGLRFLGFEVEVAHTGSQALQVVERFRPQLLLMDVMLPDIDGFELCRQIRADRDGIGVVFLTARNRTEDAIEGLAIGGDDYINKPFSLDEVVARLRAVLRRLEPRRLEPGRLEPGRLEPGRLEPGRLESGRARSEGHRPAGGGGTLRFADLEWDDERHEVRRANRRIELSPKEFALLGYLLENCGRVVTRAQILDTVWGYDFAGDASIVDSYISYLRKKVDLGEPPLIHTVRGVGYSLRATR